MIGVIGLAILVVAALAGHDSLGKYGEVVLTILGSGVIAYGHIRNYQLGRQQRSVKTH